MAVRIRDYTREDEAAVQRIHDASEIDYTLPDLAAPLFVVTKVYEVDGVIRAYGGAYLQAEVYLVLDHSNWATPDDKLSAIHSLDACVISELWAKGVDVAVLWLPPGMERFGKRLEELGFTKDRDGWRTYSKKTSNRSSSPGH